MDRLERVRFVRFATIGAVGSILDFGVMNLLTRIGHLDLVPAGTISFLCAILNNFIGNRLWTYPDSRSRHVLHQLGMFAVVNVAGVAIRIPVLQFVEPPLFQFLRRVLAAPSGTVELVAKNVTLAIAIGIVMLWNFFMNRHWTYNDIAGAPRVDT